MDLQSARAELQNIIGADLDDAEADRLLNDGHKELCVRAEWTQATILIETIAGEPNYTVPDNVYRPLKLAVNNLIYAPADSEVGRRIRAGDLTLRTNGLWWLTHNASGIEKFALYPTPSASGVEVAVICVVTPATLEEDDDAFVPPEDFHQAAIYFAAARSLGGSEDDLEARAYYMDQFDGLVGRLKRLRRSRTGSGPVNMRIVGQTA